MFPHFVFNTIAFALFSISGTALALDIISSKDFSPISRQANVPRCGSCSTTCFPCAEKALDVCNSSCHGPTLCGVQRCLQSNGSPGCRCIGINSSNFRRCGRCSRIYRRRKNAQRACIKALRSGVGFRCSVFRIVRNGSERGFQCLGPLFRHVRESLCSVLPPVQLASVRPPPITITSSAPSPVPSSAPSMSATVSSTPSTTPSPSSSSSITPSNTVSPTPSKTCSFAFTGTIGGPTTSAVCSCGARTSTVTILAPVSNNGIPIFGGAMSVASEALKCYNGCIEGSFKGFCDPAGISTFASDGQAIVTSCCSNCVSTVGVDGQGPFLASNQCRLAA